MDLVGRFIDERKDKLGRKDIEEKDENVDGSLD